MTETDKLTAYRLAHMAGCGDPDSRESVGAQWLLSIATDVPEIRERITQGDDVGDLVDQYADDAVPIYTHQMWITYVDLCAYNEDVTELVDYDGLANPDGAGRYGAGKLAAIALYLIAGRLLHALIEEADDETDEDE